MNTGSKLALTWLCGASIVALGTAGAQAQTTGGGDVETVVVTGSHVITEIQNSPTPLTLVTADQLQATTPGNIPDALNKLPVFQGSSSTRNNVIGAGNGSGNFLNLRNFGQQRTLVLLDNHRQPYDNANGSINVDNLPQMLIQRVDVVTGGASAVYGSDAVTGVVNFVLNNNFTGMKMEANAGISGYADGASEKLGFAAGSAILGGHGHFETAVEYFHNDRVLDIARQLGREHWELGGAGTTANPFRYIKFGELNTNISSGGEITCTACGTLNGMQFNQNGSGVIPVDPGTPSGVNGLQSGGDGVWAQNSPLQVALRRESFFSRFSYNLDDSTTVYMNLTAAESLDQAPYYPAQVRAGSIFDKSDPFVPASVAGQITGQTFTYATWFTDPAYQGYTAWNDTRKLQVAIGADGQLMGKYDWDVYYSHGESRDNTKDPTNGDNQKVFAASDAIAITAAQATALNAANPGAGYTTGQVVCQVLTTPSASLYPGCVPINPFGHNTLTTAGYQYAYSAVTNSAMTNGMDNISGSISGTAFDLPAGPVKVALSGEARWLSFVVNSGNTPFSIVDCTGLRYCIAGKNRYDQAAISNAPYVTNNVWEFAAETDVPLLKDIPLVQNFDVNLAGRYTDYSTSGAVQTWKVGLDYHMIDDVRFRATTSVDIRAPTLNDLFGPVSVTTANYNDLHTNQIHRVNQFAGGNPNLIPEVARTYTAGVVFTPTFLPGFTASIDYYQIHMKNAIAAVAASNSAIQALCEASGGVSQFCSLATRPNAFSDHSPANFPTSILSENLNTAFINTEGEDIEADYSFDMASIYDGFPGSVSIRELGNIQPYVYTENFTGSQITNAVQPQGRVVSFVSYTVDNWAINLQHRWLSNFRNASNPAIIYAAANARTKSTNTLDMNIDNKFTVGSQPLDGYLSVQNVFNTTSPIYTIDQSNPGRVYPVSTQEDAIGRYFTIGVRANF